MMVCLRCHQIGKMKCEKAQNPGGEKVEWWWWICLVIKPKLPSLALSSPPSTQSTPSHNMASPKFGQIWCCKVADQTIQWDSKFSMTPLYSKPSLLLFNIQCESQFKLQSALVAFPSLREGTSKRKVQRQQSLCLFWTNCFPRFWTNLIQDSVQKVQ